MNGLLRCRIVCRNISKSLLNHRKCCNLFSQKNSFQFLPVVVDSVRVIMPKRKINSGGTAVSAPAVEDSEPEPVTAKRGRSKRGVETKSQEVEEVPQAEPVKASKRKLNAKAKGEEPGSAETDVSNSDKTKLKNKEGAKAAAKKPLKNVEDVQEVDKPTRGRKKAEPAEVEAKEEKPEKVSKRGKKAAEAAEPKVTEARPKRGKKETVEKVEEEEEKEVKPKKAPKSKPAPKEKKPAAESVALANQTDTKWEAVDFTCSKKNAKGQLPNLKITSWNVDGVRAWIKKGGLSIFKYADPDIFCLQETKCSEDKLPDEAKDIKGYHRYTCASDKDGYAGVAIYSKIEPIDVQYGIGEEEHDSEGRCITAEYDNFFLICVYVPNAGRGLVTLPKRLKWNESFKDFVKSLDNQKPVVIVGDMNVAHTEIDLTNPSTNTKSAGFTKEEREGMTDFLQDGYVDTFRQLYPDKTGVYTFWSYMNKARSKNIGWRLDYFTISERIKDNVCDNVVHSDVFGSDHCPLTLFINI